MMSIYSENIVVDGQAVDCFGRLKPSQLLYYLQEVAGSHFAQLEDPTAPLSSKNLFWAVIRHRVEVNRLPRLGERITAETWPMPTTRVAYPRAMAAYDEQGGLLWRAVTLWVLMDKDSRAMVLPGKSGVWVEGTLRGTELEVPRSLLPQAGRGEVCRPVTYSVLDKNGHMNNTRYLDWVEDLLPSAFHGDHPLRSFTLCYLSEAREGQTLRLGYELSSQGVLRVDAHRTHTDGSPGEDRVFSAQVVYE